MFIYLCVSLLFNIIYRISAGGNVYLEQENNNTTNKKNKTKNEQISLI